MIRCSIIIPTFNRHDILGATLANVLGQSCVEFEVIVVDQSPEPYPEIVSLGNASPIALKYLHTPDPNLPKARNVGMRVAEGDIVLFIDDDVLIGSDYVERHLAHYSDLAVGGVTGVILPPDAAGTEFHILEQAKAHRCLGLPTLDKPFRVRWASGGNVSFRKAALISVGGFDPNYTGSGWYEDIDASVRLDDIGLKLLFDPFITLIHLAAPTGGCENRVGEKAQQHSLLILYFVSKNRHRIGLVWTIQLLWLAYRQYAMNRKVLSIGIRECASRTKELAGALFRSTHRHQSSEPHC